MRLSTILKVIAAAVLSLIITPLYAAIDYTEWTAENMSELLHDAKSKQQMVMVVVTQPDWCPPCIKLENKIIKNTDETEFSELSKDWKIFEVYGYDKEGADFLKDQNLKFHGTPTVFLLDPKQLSTPSDLSKAELARSKLKNKKPKIRLGDLKVIHSVAGVPDDFTAQFAKATGGYDLIAEAQKRVRDEQTLDAYRTLATAYVDQGKVKQANRVYQSILIRDDLEAGELQEIEWEQIFQVTQRVQKDHTATVKAIDAFVKRYPEFLNEKEQFESYAYRRAWSLVEIDRVAEAKTLLRKAYVEANDVENIKTYLYFAFRNPEPVLLKDAMHVCHKALEEFPDAEMGLMAAQGRLMRRLNRLEEAKAAFARAAELAVDDEEALETYLGQLKFVEDEIIKSKS